jgi:hypothetical protein
MPLSPDVLTTITVGVCLLAQELAGVIPATTVIARIKHLINLLIIIGISYCYKVRYKRLENHQKKQVKAKRKTLSINNLKKTNLQTARYVIPGGCFRTFSLSTNKGF